MSSPLISTTRCRPARRPSPSTSRRCAGAGRRARHRAARRRRCRKGSVQAAARALRYEFLERARAEAGADVVALAHTADDVVEGVVLHLMRGCGLAGLRGMPASRGVFVRPMLVGLAARRRRLPGPARDRRARRPGQRRTPLTRGSASGVRSCRPWSATGQASAGASTPSRSVPPRSRNRSRSRPPPRSTAAALTAPRSPAAPEPVAAELMKMLYARAGGAQPALSRAPPEVDAATGAARAGRSGRGPTWRLAVAYRGGNHGDRGATRLRRRGETDQGRASRSTGCPGCADENAAHLKAGLDLRLGFRRPGLTMRPRGGRGTRKLQDIFVDARVPREERDTWPLVFAGDKLAWVPGVAIDADL